MTERLPDTTDRAVIDIGSNSVRLVMFEGPQRCPIMSFNEKMFCGLGNLEPETGNLRQEAVIEALSTLRRFHAIVSAARPKTLIVFATAASRDAPNGRQFLKQIQKIGFNPVLLSGEEEAEYAGLGIVSGLAREELDERKTLAADIGGGSLELSVLTNKPGKWVGQKVSMPLGALRLRSQFGEDRAAARKHVRKTLSEEGWLKDFKNGRLVVVGGSWRALARIDMHNRSYPINILDQYTTSASRMTKLCELMARQSEQSLANMPNVQRRRLPTLPLASIVMDEVLAITGVDTIDVSSSGVREGALFSALSKQEQAEDPLFSSCEYFVRRFGINLRPPEEHIMQHLAVLFDADQQRAPRWHRAAAILCNLCASMHPDERAKQMAATIMALPFRGISHMDRLLLATALSARHGASLDDIEKWLPVELSQEEELLEAISVGLALRFLCAFLPAGGRLLTRGQFRRDGESLTFSLPEGTEDVWGKSPAKRLERLADALGLDAVQPV